MKIFQFLLIFVLASQISAEVFSATEDLRQLSFKGDKLIAEVKWLISALEETVDQLKRNVKIIENNQKQMEGDSLKYIANPLNALLLIKTFSFDILQTRHRLLGITSRFSTNTENIRLPREDFEGAVEGLVRLQEMYDLDPKDLAKGMIGKQKYRDDLLANDLYAIGEELLSTDDHITSLSYLNLALETNDKSRDMSDLPILERLYQIHNKTNDSGKIVETLDKILKLAPERKDLEEIRMDHELKILLNEKEAKPEKKNQPILMTMRDGGYSRAKELNLISKACRGTQRRSEAVLKDLYCTFVAKTAFSKIAPFKVEVFNLDPYIAVFYDVISDLEIKAFKSLSKPNLNRAGVLNKDATTKIAKVRVAKLSWHGDSTHEIFERLTKRVGDMSGLNMKTAEDWQTQNYGIGGHYDAHHDFTVTGAKAFSTGTGNRIATALFYLSDVELGGATVFPYLKVTVFPKKGAAVYWYNLSTSGDLEWYTRHSGCPVLVGSKWVANKWLHEYGQERTRPCGLAPVETDELYYTKFF